MKTVSTLQEWADYAVCNENPRAEYVGELAGRLRQAFKADQDAPIIFYEEDWEIDRWCTCCEPEGTSWVIECAGRRADFATRYFDPTWAELNDWLDRSAPQ